jgi:farnesyl-diphosphate farnesyltransferase
MSQMPIYSSISTEEKWLFRRLKASARSFYLSLRLLPASVRLPIALAYLLARIADTLADHSLWSTQKRLVYLNRYRDALFQGGKEFDIPADDSAKLSRLDREIIADTARAFGLLRLLNDQDISEIKHVIDTLTRGMIWDLEYFSPQDEVKALKTDQDLEHYIYLVAGCVGEFWTNICIDHIPALSGWNRDLQIENGVYFGKALQLTNILRDLPKDHALGRCYIPDEFMSPVESSPSRLVATLSPDEVNMLTRLINRDLSYYQKAIAYTLAVPRTQVRLRLACAIPILIGLRTITLLYNELLTHQTTRPVKIARNEVYNILFKSVLAAPSNKQLTKLFESSMPAIH